MKQIVDLEGSPEFRSLNVALVSIAIDPVVDLSWAVSQFGISAPLLSDKGRKVSESYGALQWAMPNGEPGHTFVLVGKNGKVKWIRDYGAPENGGLMYVSVDVLYQEMVARLKENTLSFSLNFSGANPLNSFTGRHLNVLKKGPLLRRITSSPSNQICRAYHCVSKLM